MSDYSPTVSAHRRRDVIFAALLLAAAVLAAVLFFGGGGTEEPGEDEQGPEQAQREAAHAASDALDSLASTSAEVTTSLSFASIPDVVAEERELDDAPPVSTVPGVEPPDGVVGVVRSGFELESGKVDFASGTAVGEGSNGAVPPSVIVDGTTYMDFSGSPLGELIGVSGWVEVPASAAVGIDTQSTTLRALLDVVATREVWLSDIGEEDPGGTFTVEVDTDALAARDDERLAALDDELAAVIRGELAAGRRARAGSRMEVTVGGEGLPTMIRLEVVAGDRVASLTWELSNFGVDVSASAPGDVTPYEEFSAALAERTAPSAPLEGSVTPEPPDVPGVPGDLLEGMGVPTPGQAGVPAPSGG